MKKREFIKSGLLATGGLGLFGTTSLLSTAAARANASAISNLAEDLVQADFTVPSWTLYKRALVAGKSEVEARAVLLPKEQPFNIVASINGDPSTRMGITWYTNAGQKGQYIEYVKGEADSDFTGAQRINAGETDINDLIYNNSQNSEVSGKHTGSYGGPYTLVEDENYPKVFDLYETRSYVSHKVLLTGLDPDSLYSYRVGKDGYFRKGSFHTAKNDKSSFEFIYIADTQAMNETYFDVSTRTVTVARNVVPDAAFLLCAGDHVESNKGEDVTPDKPFSINSSYYIENSEWEWEQWFERMQDTWLKLPVVPVQGNHDTAAGRHNMFHHFNTDRSYNSLFGAAGGATDMDGTVYSFVCGNALFMVINFEDYQKGEPYFTALEAWMEEQIKVHPDVKWRIVTYHKTVFTGSGSHQDDADSKTVRMRMAKVFERLGIDLAMQGHDHIYETIGVVTAHETEYSLVTGAVTDRIKSAPVPRNAKGETPNMTGWDGGVFDVTHGMLYFLNNSAGLKKYYPRSREEMAASIDKHNITDYFDMFSKFGQTGEPTFSRVRVSTDAVDIFTYTVDANGKATLFDEIKIVRDGSKQTGIDAIRSDNSLRICRESDRLLRIEAPEAVVDVRMYAFSGVQVLFRRGSNLLDISGISAGIYLLNVRTVSGVYTERFIVKP